VRILHDFLRRPQQSCRYLTRQLFVAHRRKWSRGKRVKSRAIVNPGCIIHRFFSIAVERREDSPSTAASRSEISCRTITDKQAAGGLVPEPSSVVNSSASRSQPSPSNSRNDG
jgi:hypothetical protein